MAASRPFFLVVAGGCAGPHCIGVTSAIEERLETSDLRREVLVCLPDFLSDSSLSGRWCWSPCPSVSVCSHIFAIVAAVQSFVLRTTNPWRSNSTTSSPSKLLCAARSTNGCNPARVGLKRASAGRSVWRKSIRHRKSRAPFAEVVPGQELRDLRASFKSGGLVAQPSRAAQ